MAEAREYLNIENVENIKYVTDGGNNKQYSIRPSLLRADDVILVFLKAHLESVPSCLRKIKRRLIVSLE